MVVHVSVTSEKCDIIFDYIILVKSIMAHKQDLVEPCVVLQIKGMRAGIFQGGAHPENHQGQASASLPLLKT